jgi:hypothetical protein
MTDFVAKTDRVTQALKNLLTQFHGKPNMEAFVASFVQEVQALEYVFIDLALLRALSNAEGVQLDGLGDIVGEKRLGRVDDDYRAAIEGKIRINRMHGRIEDVILGMKLTLDNTYEITQLVDATMLVYMQEAWDPINDPSLETLITALRNIRGGGIKTWFQYGIADDDNIFRFATADLEEASTTQGFANDAETTGGYWAEILEV